MTLRDIPPEWLHPASLTEAAATQRLLAERVVASDAFGPVGRLGGTDISHNIRDPDEVLHAAIVTLDYPGLAVTGVTGVSLRSDFPYRPGFLGFRETPSLVEAYRKLDDPPDLIFVDGHGLSHPRGLGIACHFGVLLDIPTIGVAKSILVGRPEGELGPNPGDSVPLVWKGRRIGMVLRTKLRCNPLYISTGHRVSLETAVQWVMRACKGYRLPEPTRQAHMAANRLRTSSQGSLPLS